MDGTPLANGSDGGHRQLDWAFEEFEIHDISRLTNNGLQSNRALDVILSRLRWVDGLHFPEQQTGRGVPGNADLRVGL